MTGSTFRAFRGRNFRLFFFGQALSVAGTWAQRVALGWLAYRLTHSSLFLGLVAFAASAPAFLLTPIAGVIADRVDRRRMLIWAQLFGLLQAAGLAMATLAGVIGPNWLLFLSVVLGVVNAFENPARQSFYSELVDPEDLPNAVALNASLVNAARVVGPAAAGVLVAVWGEGVCFAINAFSFLAVIIALAMITVTPRASQTGSGRSWELLREGFDFVRGRPVLRAMLLNFAIFNLVGSPYLTLLPILTAEGLSSGAAALGWLVSASGLGAIVTSLALASRSSTKGLPAASFIASAIAGAALVVLGISNSFALSVVMMVLIGGGYVLTLAATQTMMQTWASEAMRGRVMSFYSLIFLGVPPLGSLIAGIAAEKLHANMTISIGGLLCLIAAIFFACAKSPGDDRVLQTTGLQGVAQLPYAASDNGTAPMQ
jgi:MFS family permease